MDLRINASRTIISPASGVEGGEILGEHANVLENKNHKNGYLPLLLRYMTPVTQLASHG